MMPGAQPGQLGAGLGLTGSVFANGWPGAVYPGAGAASGVPEGPATITQQAFGVPGPGSGMGKRRGLTAAGIGTLALAALVFIWWSLPR
jgi:hypothetical protein